MTKQKNNNLGFDPLLNFPTAFRVFSKLVGSDLVSVQPTSEPIGKLHYMDIDPARMSQIHYDETREDF